MAISKIFYAFAAVIFLLLCFKIVVPTDKLDVFSGAFALIALGLLFDHISFADGRIVIT